MSFSIPSRFIRKGPCGSGGAWTAAAGSGGAGGAWSTGTGVAGGPVPLGPGDASIDGEATGTGVGVGTNTGVGTGAGLGAGLGDGRGSATGESTKQEPRSSVRCTANYKRPHDRANSRDIPTTRGRAARSITTVRRRLASARTKSLWRTGAEPRILERAARRLAQANWSGGGFGMTGSRIASMRVKTLRSISTLAAATLSST